MKLLTFACMLKQTIKMRSVRIILTVVAAWCLTSLAGAQGVKVTQIVPLSCKSGEKCTIEIEIDKQGIEGFARIQQVLPDGFTATLLQDAGSDFAFDKQKVSFIWLSIPATPVIRVAYQISVNPGISGSVTLTDGVFSYILDNKIQKAPIPPATMEINGKGEPIAAKTEVPVVVQPPVKEEPIKVTEAEPQKPEPVKEPEKQVEMPVEPKVEQPAGGIKKEPEPVKVIETPEPEPQKVAEAPKPEPVKVVEPPKPEPTKVAETPKPEPVMGGMVYRVQFSALKSSKDTEELKKQFGIQDQVFHEVSADGWHRYSFGQWSSKAEADAACKAFNNRTGKSAFVVKFSDGKRVTGN